MITWQTFAKYGCSPAQLALAWINHQGEDIVPIPGTTKIKNLDDNIGPLRVKLSKQNLKEISKAVPIGEVVGDRSYQGYSNLSWKFSNTPPKGNN
ncbi:hypothetical protein Sjap_008060 [Stephania japonica]|uniref:NADP-dependent oxidoreductase domain-containing protein n=1 Tax=Stephania japonica TaxID=461633 RepID=A0AAP0JNS7_9MAGN